MDIFKYVKGDNLKAENFPRTLVHSCNCNGTWGGGIAYQLALKYPDAERGYTEKCKRYVVGLLGKSLLLRTKKDPNLIIGRLFTDAFGGYDQNASLILKYTKKALQNFSSQLEQDPKLLDYQIIMPKINSGIFGVPWEQTEKLLEESTENFTVYVI